MNILQNTFNKHLRLLKEHLKLNEGYSSEDVTKFFADLKSKLSAKNVNYAEFLKLLEIAEKNDTGEHFAEQAEYRTKKQLDTDQLMSFKEDIYSAGGDNIYDYDDDVVNYIISVFITWRHVQADYKEQRKAAAGDMDAMDQLDMHPGISFTEFLNHSK